MVMGSGSPALTSPLCSSPCSEVVFCIFDNTFISPTVPTPTGSCMLPVDGLSLQQGVYLLPFSNGWFAK